ncbi:hypothetical protein [Thiolinea disciformis]|uniref:hypothetical protein n=1 Tax=Thiolinea disciformis TaxID=125614 RepID=UPI0003660E57|nr:hypothetical protein [Thiolinea disciformis]
MISKLNLLTVILFLSVIGSCSVSNYSESNNAHNDFLKVTNALSFSEQTKTYELLLKITNKSTRNLLLHRVILHDMHYSFDFFQNYQRVNFKRLFKIQDFSARDNFILLPNDTLEKDYSLGGLHPDLQKAKEKILVKWEYVITDIANDSASLKTESCPTGNYIASGSFIIDPNVLPNGKDILAKVICQL